MSKAHVSPKSAPTPTSTPRPGATPVNGLSVDASPLPSPSGNDIVSFSGAPAPAARPSPIRLNLPIAAFGGSSAVSRRSGE